MQGRLRARGFRGARALDGTRAYRAVNLFEAHAASENPLRATTINDFAKLGTALGGTPTIVEHLPNCSWGVWKSPASLFAALGDPTRLGLVARLCTSGPMSIVRLTEGARVTRQSVTKHLHVLAGACLVRSTRVGVDHFLIDE